jgi:hypothetical protein
MIMVLRVSAGRFLGCFGEETLAGFAFELCILKQKYDYVTIYW